MKVKMTVAALAALMGLVTSAASEADIAAFREARFGMFIHWGLYSQLGGRWKGVTMPHVGERLGYVRRTEDHGISAHDWMWMMDFADRIFGRGVPPVSD